MSGEDIVLNLIALKQAAKFEGWFDDLMVEALDHAIILVAADEGVDIEKVTGR